MFFIIYVVGLVKIKEICFVVKGKISFIMGDYVVKAIFRKFSIFKLLIRLEVGGIVGYSLVSSCVFSFEGDEELFAEFFRYG